MARTKKWQSTAGDLETVLVQMLTPLMDNIHTARALLNNLSKWTNEVLDRMGDRDLASTEEVQSMLDAAKEFPVRVDMAEDLAVQLEAAQTAESGVVAFLNKTELDYEEHEKLASQVCLFNQNNIHLF